MTHNPHQYCLHLNPDGKHAVLWHRDNNSRLHCKHEGLIQDLPNASDPCDCCLLLPATWVSLWTMPPIPKPRGKALNAKEQSNALSFAMEKTHGLAPGHTCLASCEGDPSHVMVANQALPQSCMHRIEAQGYPINRAIPDCLPLPITAEGWTLHQDKQLTRIRLMNSAYLGFKNQQLPHWLETLRQTHPPKHIVVLGKTPPELQATLPNATIEVLSIPDHWLIEQALASETSFDMTRLQPPKPIQTIWQKWPRWMPRAIAGAWLCLGIGYMLWR